MSPPRESDSENDGNSDEATSDADSGDDTDTLPGLDDDKPVPSDATEPKQVAVKSWPPATNAPNNLSNGDISEEAAHMMFGPEDDAQASCCCSDDAMDWQH